MIQRIKILLLIIFVQLTAAAQSDLPSSPDGPFEGQTINGYTNTPFGEPLVKHRSLADKKDRTSPNRNTHQYQYDTRTEHRYSKQGIDRTTVNRPYTGNPATDKRTGIYGNTQQSSLPRMPLTTISGGAPVHNNTHSAQPETTNRTTGATEPDNGNVVPPQAQYIPIDENGDYNSPRDYTESVPLADAVPFMLLLSMMYIVIKQRRLN